MKFSKNILTIIVALSFASAAQADGFIDGLSDIGSSIKNSFSGSTCAIAAKDRTTNIAIAQQQVEKKLSNKKCKSSFDGYWRYMISVGSGSPDESNLEAYIAVLDKALAMSAVDGNKWRRYMIRSFDPEFVTMTMTGGWDISEVNSNLCTVDSRRYTGKVEGNFVAAMKAELQAKEIGISQILNDSKKYMVVEQMYADIMNSVKKACSAAQVYNN